MTLSPSSTVVAVGWFSLAVPDVGVDRKLPSATNAMRSNGFVRIQLAGGSPDVDVASRSPVIAAECWVPPSAAGDSLAPWNQAEHLAERLIEATYDRTLMNVAVDLSGLGDYGPAHVFTVVALGEPRQGPDDPSNWARFDVTAQLTWIGA